MGTIGTVERERERERERPQQRESGVLKIHKQRLHYARGFSTGEKRCIHALASDRQDEFPEPTGAERDALIGQE